MNNFLKMVSIVLLFGTSSLSFAQLVENKDYTVLDNRVIHLSKEQDKVEVVEFFNYGCPYCYRLEPEMSAWFADKPDNVEVIKIAIPRKGKWVEYARLFYALGMISKAEQERISPLIYAAIHEQKLNFASEKDLFDWTEKQNVNRQALEQYYASNEVTEKIKQAVELALSYDLKYVPSIYVNGQYQLILDSSNNYEGTKDKLNELIILAEK